MSNICSFYGVRADTFRKQYKNKLSNFREWDQLKHCEDYILYPQNIGPNLSLDEVSLTQGELYTFLTNKDGKGKKGTIVACIAGTKSEQLIKILQKIPLNKRSQVKEITLDMANTMQLTARTAFPTAYQVTDRFHVVRLGMEALQNIRVQLRWIEIDKENELIKECRKLKKVYKSEYLENGDTYKQLLARSRYILAKKESKWTENQKERAELLFKTYPQLLEAYKHTLVLRNVYEEISGLEAIKKLKEWIDKSRKMEKTNFNSVANTIENNFETIINFFRSRSTNASAESFNSKIKLFRANLRGVTDTRFFLYRLSHLFA